MGETITAKSTIVLTNKNPHQHSKTYPLTIPAVASPDRINNRYQLDPSAKTIPDELKQQVADMYSVIRVFATTSTITVQSEYRRTDNFESIVLDYNENKLAIVNRLQVLDLPTELAWVTKTPIAEAAESNYYHALGYLQTTLVADVFEENFLKYWQWGNCHNHIHLQNLTTPGTNLYNSVHSYTINPLTGIHQKTGHVPHIKAYGDQKEKYEKFRIIDPGLSDYSPYNASFVESSHLSMAAGYNTTIFALHTVFANTVTMCKGRGMTHRRYVLTMDHIDANPAANNSDRVTNLQLIPTWLNSVLNALRP